MVTVPALLSIPQTLQPSPVPWPWPARCAQEKPRGPSFSLGSLGSVRWWGWGGGALAAPSIYTGCCYPEIP